MFHNFGIHAWARLSAPRLQQPGKETPRSSESTPSVAAAEEDWTGRVGTIGEGEEASEGHDDRCEEEAEEEEGEEEEAGAFR